MAVTSIQIRTETRDLLRALSGKGETYDDIIVELAAAYDAYIGELLRKLEKDWNESRPLEEVLDEIDRSIASRRGKKA